MAPRDLGQTAVSTNSPCVVLYLKPNHHERFEKALKAHGGKVEGKSRVNKERALMNIIAAAEQAAP